MNRTPSTFVLPHCLTRHEFYQAAAITGYEANPNKIHEVQKVVTHAARIADEMEAADRERGI